MYIYNYTYINVYVYACVRAQGCTCVNDIFYRLLIVSLYGYIDRPLFD